MIDDIGATEAEARDEVDLSQGDAKAIGTGTKRREEAEPMAHNGGVVQWAADGHITVTGHGSQEHTFCAHECNEEVKLYHTVSEGDAVAHGPKTKQQPGYSHRDAPGLQGQAGHEEVHRLVQRQVLLHQQDDDHIFSHCRNIGHEQHEEHCCTHTPVPRKPHQNEPGDPCLVLHFHIGDTGLNSPGGKNHLVRLPSFAFSD